MTLTRVCACVHVDPQAIRDPTAILVVLRALLARLGLQVETTHSTQHTAQYITAITATAATVMLA